MIALVQLNYKMKTSICRATSRILEPMLYLASVFLLRNHLLLNADPIKGERMIHFPINSQLDLNSIFPHDIPSTLLSVRI